MSIKIHRNTGFMGSAGFMKIKVNGQVEKLKLDEPNIINIKENTATIELKELGSKTQTLTVNDGEIIEIIAKKWFIPFFFSIIFSLL